MAWQCPAIRGHYPVFEFELNPERVTGLIHVLLTPSHRFAILISGLTTFKARRT